MKWFIQILVLLAPCFAFAQPSIRVRGANITEIGRWMFDAAPAGQPKTEAQNRIDQLYEIGVRHVLLNPRAVMRHPRSNDVIPVTPLERRMDERQRYGRFIKYIHSKGMTVGMRPIFFVVDDHGNPFKETLPNGQIFYWWHGNIQPKEPFKWFQSFGDYLEIYRVIAAENRIAEFTLGAELYSMTVGIEDQWKENPYGFPEQWQALLANMRRRLPQGTRIMYDINFTDATVRSGEVQNSGGELERWRYRLVDLANPADPAQNATWQKLKAFWNGLDAVGIDMYRSLASNGDSVPKDYEQLVSQLRIYTDRFASQIDSTLSEIDMALERPTPTIAIFKEVGFRSVEKGYIEPFSYSRDGGTLNVMHQKAAWDAIFRSFWAIDWPWMGGMNFWDVSVDPTLHGPTDKGFSPLGKPSMDLFKQYYK